MNESQVFGEVLKLATPAERAAYLDEVCAGNPQLRADVEALLRAHASDPDFLEQPVASLPATAAASPPAGDPAGVAADPATTEWPGMMLAGRYRLLEPIGEGGMGTVWMAKQTEPVKRLVAIKLIKSGLASKEVLARFEAERQALALMDHPNIAKVLDAGTTTGEPAGVNPGRPFFVMELVKGVPITRFCDEQRLTPRQRLELFVPVCEAVQHAHHKGVIHRDLKPSNVLVAMYDDRPVPKVIDFGVAKATGQQLSEQTLHTGFGTVVGTVEYMSPEQATFNQLDVDTRSDIYSLGVLLYELLTGSPPFTRKELEKAGVIEMLRLIREQEPSKPSTKLSAAEGLPTLAANRGTEPKRLRTLVRGELDWIVMKALEKDRRRRYETATGFAMDVQRYLHDEPVLACPPSAWYRFRKFSRRNKTALTIASLVLLTVLLGTGSAGWAMKDRAYRRAMTDVRAEQALDESNALYQKRKLPEALQAARGALDLVADGRGGPAAESRARKWLKDLEMAARLEELRFEQGKVKRTLVTDAFRDYGIDLEALPPADAAAKIAALPIRVDLVITLDAWGHWLTQMGDYYASDPEDRKKVPAVGARWSQIARLADPDPLRNRIRDAFAAPWQRAREMLQEVAPAIDPATTPLATVLLLGEGWNWRWGGGNPSLFTAVRQRYPDDFEVNYQVGLVQDLDGKIRCWTAAVAIRPQNAWVRCFLGTALREKGLVDEAIAQFREAVRLGPKDNYIIMYKDQLARALLQKKEGQQEALDLFREIVREHPNDSRWPVQLASALFDVGRTEEAIAEYRKAIRLVPDNGGLSDIAGALDSKGLVDEAIAVLRENVRRFPKDSYSHVSLGDLLRKKGALEEAIQAYDEAVRVMPENSLALFKRGGTYAQLGRWNAALTSFDRSLQPQPWDHEWRFQAAAACLGAGNVEGYRRNCRELVRQFGDKDQPRSAERTVTTCVLLPDALGDADFDRVRKLAERAVTGTEKDADYRLFVLARGLVEYRAGHPADAVNWLGRFSPNTEGTHRDATAFAALALAYHNMRPTSGEIVCTLCASDFDRVQQLAQRTADGTEKDSLYRRFMRAKAEEALARAKAIMTRKMPDPARGRPFGDDWYSWLVARVFCREAEILLKKDPGIEKQESGKKPD